MENALEIFKIILPTIIAAISTFLITKYTYNKNKPLDKLEIAYNRVYYPILRIISNRKINNNDINEVIDKSKIYFVKYDKYIDTSTKRLFEALCNCQNITKKKTIYENFTNNINNRNSFLRRRLGYLEPNFAQIYKYSVPSTKSFFRIIIELVIIYITLILFSATEKISYRIYIVSFSIFLSFVTIIICELIWCILRAIFYRIGDKLKI